jgi:lysophospholipase L1-like esterase
MTGPDLSSAPGSPSPLINAKPAIMACLGSSSTAGKGQAYDWIGELRRRPRNKGVSFLNFGVGGDLAYNALQRLPAVLSCHPSKVVVLIGGNDVLALVSKTASGSSESLSTFLLSRRRNGSARTSGQSCSD